MNIVLIGYRCSGKTTVGALLAQRLGKAFLDTDALVEERAGRSIQAVVAETGWDSFRELEKQAVRDLLGMKNLVVATGGGVVMDLENVASLKQHGWLVWLNTDAGEIERRMRQDQKTGDTRPSLTDNDPLSEIERVLQTRSRSYRRVSDCVVNTTDKSPEAVVDDILAALPWTQGPCRTDGVPREC